MTFTKGDLQNWDERATDLSFKGMNYEANELLMHVYNNMTICNKTLSEHELYRLFLGLGATSYAINENKKAMYFFDRAISVSDEYDKNNNENVASAVVGKTAVLKSQKKYKEAFEILDSFSRNYNRQFVIEEYPNIYVELAYGAKQYDKGITFGIDAIDIAKRKKTYVSETMIYMLSYLSSCFFEQRRWKLGYEVEEEKLRLLELLRLEDTLDWIDAVLTCTQFSCYRRQYKKAKEFLDKLEFIDLDDKSEDQSMRMLEIRHIYWKGFIAMKLGNYKDSNTFFDECMKKVECSGLSDIKDMKAEIRRQKTKLDSLFMQKKATKPSAL